MEFRLAAMWLSVVIMPCGLLASHGILAGDIMGSNEGRIIKVVDYKNPMKLDLDLLDNDAVIGSGDSKTKKYDYYKSKPTQEWAEGYHIKPGLQKMSQGNFEGAFNEFAFVLRYVPNHPRALSLMGDMAILTNRVEVAEGYFKKAFELYPQTVRASSHKDYGRFLYRSGNFTGAIEALKKSLQMDTNLSEAHYYLGLTYCALNDFTRANHHAQIIYSKGFPLGELREKLIIANAWSPASPAPSGVGQDNPGVDRNRPIPAGSGPPTKK